MSQRPALQVHAPEPSFCDLCGKRLFVILYEDHEGNQILYKICDCDSEKIKSLESRIESLEYAVYRKDDDYPGFLKEE